MNHACASRYWAITECLLRCKSSLDEVEPEDDLTELNVGRVLEADDDDADAVSIADKQVVGHMVRLVAGELPHAYLTDAWNGSAHTQNIINSMLKAI